MEGVEHQQGLLQRLGGDGAHFGIIQQLDQRRNVVAAQHGAQQLGRLGARDQRALLFTQRHGGQVRSLDLGGVIHAGRHAVGDQFHQVLLFTGGRVLQQFDQLGRLLGGQGQRGDAKRGALGHMCAIVFKHGNLLSN
ncbi:hypothetical protein D9M72_610130 [compost metagenome]